MLTLNALNGIEGWQDARGRNILFPKQKLNGKVRGGAHPCAPVFGNVPAGQTDWARYKLPQHGLFRVEGAEVSLGAQTIESGYTCTTKRYEAQEDYPFKFMIDESFREYEVERMLRLDHTITLQRDYECQADTLMPVSLGWHPYFATHGEDFAVLINDRAQVKPEDRTNPAAVFDHFNQRVILETRYHTIKFEFFNTDEIVFWSDDKSQYICIEPTTKTKNPHLLRPGNLITFGTRVTLLR